MTAIYADAAANSMLTVLAGLGAYISLHSADPGKTGASELTGNGYARQTLAFHTAASQHIKNNGAIEFGPATPADWVAATYFGMWSAVSGGTFIAGAALDAPVTVLALGTASFADNALEISLAAAL